MSIYSITLNIKEPVELPAKNNLLVRAMEKKSNDKPTSALKIKAKVKILALIFSAITLSWCFEGFRQIKTAPTLAHYGLLVVGIISTALLLWIQAFWIYIEEKSKGTLAKKVIHFDHLQEWLEKRTNMSDKGDKANRD